MLTDAGVQEGSRALREAASLAPNNRKVREAFVKVHHDESLQPLLQQCRTFSKSSDEVAAREALWYLSAEGPSVPGKIAEKCLQLALDAPPTKAGAEKDVRDDLIASLLEHCLGARKLAARKFIDGAAAFFNVLFDTGDGAAAAITRVVLDGAAWEGQLLRQNCEKDVFLLFLAKLLESDSDYDGRAVKGISRHLALGAERLHQLIDDESFAAILKCLDYRLESETRTQATLATAKYLEASKATGEEYLTKFIARRTKRHGTEDLVIAFSTAAATFPIATQVISALFLIEGFLPSLVPLLDKKSRPIKVEKAALDMLSAACIDSACRRAIAKHCLDWMHHVMDDKDDERQGQAAVILAKVQDSIEMDGERRRRSDIVDVVPTLKAMLSSSVEMDRRAAVEGLAYASMQPLIKDDIAYDPALIKKLLEPPKKDSMSAAKTFGALTLLDNLTRYRPLLSDEQQRMTQLQAYANAAKPSKPAPPDPLESDAHVAQRCHALVAAGVVPYLIALKASAVAHPLSPAACQLGADVLRSLAKSPESRGRLAQQGAIPLLLALHKASAADPQDPAVARAHLTRQTAAHAIARILISVNPRLIGAHAENVVAPLVALLDLATTTSTSSAPVLSADAGARDLLPAFEALLALTNLVSDPALGTGPSLARLGHVPSPSQRPEGKTLASNPPAVANTAPPFAALLDDLLLHAHPLLRRATAELLCNLTATTAEGRQLFCAPADPACARRLGVLLALASSDDLPTRLAVGGALVAVTESEEGVRGVLERKGVAADGREVDGIARVLGLLECADDDEEDGVASRLQEEGVVLRACVVLGNMLTVEERGERCRQKRGTRIWARRALRARRAAEALAAVIEAREGLAGAGPEEARVVEAAREALAELER